MPTSGGCASTFYWGNGWFLLDTQLLDGTFFLSTGGYKAIADALSDGEEETLPIEIRSRTGDIEGAILGIFNRPDTKGNNARADQLLSVHLKNSGFIILSGDVVHLEDHKRVIHLPVQKTH